MLPQSDSETLKFKENVTNGEKKKQKKLCSLIYLFQEWCLN